MLNDPFPERYGLVLNYFRTLFPRDQSNRLYDLDRLLSLDSSFCLFSDYRNGTTTLLHHLARVKQGKYIDAMSLPSTSRKDPITVLEAEIGTAPLVILDETATLWNKLGHDESGLTNTQGYELGMEYLQRLTATRQVGLRIHPKDEYRLDDLSIRGFSTVHLAKIIYAELQAIVEQQMGSIGFAFPEEVVLFAHKRFTTLSAQLQYIGCAFELLITNPEMATKKNIMGLFTEKTKMMFGRNVQV